MSDSAKELYEIIGMVKEHMAFQRMCGLDEYPRGEKDTMSDASVVGTKDHPLSIKTKGMTIAELKRPAVINEVKESQIIDLSGSMKECNKCKLANERTKIVFGEGSLDADLVFVGEAPGRDEDESGRPFVGRAGKLLTKIIMAMGLTREDVYIMNIVKCRPPGNRNPEADEIKTCEPYMLRQLDIIKPKIICTLGTFSSQTLLKSTVPISKIRGKFFDYYHGIKLMPTYHPAFLLRNAGKKKEVWEDMQLIMKELK
ncbi:uracil-DNA glycosylase [Thermodesulfobacteriota bacterium]